MPLSFTIAVLYNKEKGRSEYHKEHPTFSTDRISENQKQGIYALSLLSNR
jgi:hypothetical protein